MRAVEDGDLVHGHALVLHECADALEDELGLLAVVHALHEKRLLGVAAGGAELLVEVAALGLGEQDAVGEGEDLGRRAVVGLDAVDDGARVAVRERHDVLEVCAAPRVDALRVVTHGHDAVVRGEPVHDLGLDGVGVLVFVHQHVAEAVGEIRGHLGGVGQELEPELEQVVVVHDVLRALLLGIGGVESREAVADVGVLREVSRDRLGERELGVAREGEDVEQRAGAGVGLVLEEQLVLGLDGLLEEGLGLVGVEDGEILRQPDRLAVDPERAVAERVERAAPEPGRLDAGEVLHAVQHFLGGLVGEGEEEDLAGLHALGEQVGDAVGEGAGLAGAGAGEDEQRSGGGGDGVELLVVELRAEINRRDAVGRARGVEGNLHESPQARAKRRRRKAKIRPAARSSGSAWGSPRRGFP